jgi:hypothetical protein|tara:strand:- start:80 stop:310 length:231 start_codon:yes stop_codon:yes gene_type:complete
MITILKGYTMEMTLISMTKDQLQFVIDECKSNLEFGDYINQYEGVDTLTSDTTTHLETLVSLLHQCVTKKENMTDD